MTTTSTPNFTPFSMKVYLGIDKEGRRVIGGIKLEKTSEGLPKFAMTAGKSNWSTYGSEMVEEEMAEWGVSSTLWEEFKIVWDSYHLNDLTAGCTHQIAAGWDKRKLDDSQPWVQKNMAMWTRPSEHPRGVLAKPCPVCGYKYGSKWLHTDIPQDVLDLIMSWQTRQE